MIAAELIAEDLPPLKHTDTGDTALHWMDEFRVSHLPVLKGNNFVGVVSDADIYDKADPSKTLHELFDVLPRPYVYEYSHIYDVMKIISEVGVTVVPILDGKENYVGCTHLLHVMRMITGIGSIEYLYRRRQYITIDFLCYRIRTMSYVIDECDIVLTCITIIMIRMCCVIIGSSITEFPEPLVRKT